MADHPTVIRRKRVETRTGLSRSAIYAKLRQNPKRPTDFDPTFPRPIQIGPRAVGWIESEIDAWLAAQAAARNWTAPSAPTPKPAPGRQRNGSRRRPLALPAAVPVLDAEELAAMEMKDTDPGWRPGIGKGQEETTVQATTGVWASSQPDAIPSAADSQAKAAEYFALQIRLAAQARQQRRKQ